MRYEMGNQVQKVPNIVGSPARLICRDQRLMSQDCLWFPTWNWNIKRLVLKKKEKKVIQD